MINLPTGTISFVFTDVQGSTRRWQDDPAGMRTAMAQHDSIAQAVVERHEGHVVKARGEGDSLFLVFDRATNAVSAALALQLAFADHAWPTAEPIRVRMAVGTGEAAVRDGDYYGTYVNRVARLRAVGHGGQVLISTSTRDLVCDALPDGVTLIDLGEQQLADLTRPERVYQLAGAGLATDFPPLKSLNVLPNNLPRQTTSFIGREKEITDLNKLLTDNALVTVMGSGGVGKSRICFQVAADLLGQFPDGVWATELASVNGSEQAQARIASSVSAMGADPVDSLVATIKGKSMLLVIDNCEHVIDGVRALAQAMLTRCPKARILATSRERLDVPGEAVYRLPSLAAPDPNHMPPLHAVTEFDAIRLFTQRAQLLDAAFVVTEVNAAAVAGICSRLDGIPLAIELAASRTKVLPPAEILKRLNQRFKLLTGGSRLALPRQQTLLATIEWGYDLLTDAEKLLLQRLSVFVDGWTMEAAEQVCSGDGIEEWDVLDLLTSLIDKSMVLPYDDKYGQPRYRLLESVRQFAAEKLEAASQRTPVRERHAAYFENRSLEMFDRHPEDLPDLDDGHVCHVEGGNMLAAIDYLCEDGISVDADRACLIFHPWAVFKGNTGGTQWRGVFESIRAKLRIAATPACVTALAFYVGNLPLIGANAECVLSAAQEALDLARRAGDRRSQYGCLKTVAEAQDKLGREVEADMNYSEAARIGEELGAAKLLVGALATIAYRHWTRGEYRQSLDCNLELININSAREDLHAMAYQSTDAGHMAYMLGDFSAAELLFEQAAVAFARGEIHNGLMLRHRADLYGALGRYTDAWRNLLETHEHTMMHALPFFLAQDYETTSYLHASEGAFDAAAKLLGAANARRILADPNVGRVIPEQQEYDKIVPLIVAGIGEAECNRLIAEGERLTDEQANALVVRMAATVDEAPMAFEDV